MLLSDQVSTSHPSPAGWSLVSAQDSSISEAPEMESRTSERLRALTRPSPPTSPQTFSAEGIGRFGFSSNLGLRILELLNPFPERIGTSDGQEMVPQLLNHFQEDLVAARILTHILLVSLHLTYR